MPTYEYRCAACGQHVEVVQSFTDDPLTECGACGGPLKKVFGAVGIVFKGSGFYKTDSRGSSKSGDGKVADAKPAETKPSESKASETKAGSDAGTSKPSGGEAKTA